MSPLKRAYPVLYIAIVVLVAAGAYTRQLRADSIYACPANGYTADRYLAYCQADHYGDYEHGAFWYELEPRIRESLAGAHVLLIGNSRLQWAFSNTAVERWFESVQARYYLLGFSYYETFGFEERLLRKMQPQARVYVINLDGFFDIKESVPAQIIQRDEDARSRYETKRRWQDAHRAVCGRAPWVCGSEYAVYRSQLTGTWYPIGGHFTSEPTSDDREVDAGFVRQQLAQARSFVARLPVNRDCIVLTIVPTYKTRRASAEAIAAELGLPLISPDSTGLTTFDGSHLERRSAERWASVFLEQAGPRIRQCLGPTGRDAS